jgi:hypothetical protein
MCLACHPVVARLELLRFSIETISIWSVVRLSSNGRSLAQGV